MKRWIALLLALAMCLSLVSCGGSTEDEGAQDAGTESTQAADSEEEEVPADEAEETESTDGEEDPLIRTTQYGQVQGVDQDGVQVYYGIPYGADPVDELRWAEPTAPESWDDVLDCTEQEEIALHKSNGYNSDGTVSTTIFCINDWLNLDIYTTSDAENLPVLVYVHGGNNQTGSSYGEVVGNDLVVNAECVVVSLNYRTGLFGYNALPAITEEGTSGNYGLLDIAFALQWVRDNISEFGGDASNVTVSGFSAGGRNVMAMLVSPAFEGLFDQAIVFSGGMTICDLDDAAQKDAEIMAPLVVEDGLAETEEEAAEWLMQDTDEVREYLYSIDADRMAEIMSDAGIRMANFPHLFGDDIVLPSSGFEGAEYVNDVPVIMLTGTTEFSLFAAFDGYFYAIEDEEVQNAARTFAISYGSDFYRIFNTQLSAETMYDSYSSDIYVVQVNYGGDDSASTIATFGAFHGIFVPMLSSTHNYGSFADFTGAGYTAMSEVFNAYLKNFLYTGDPNSDDTAVEWTTWDTDTMQTLVLDASEDTGEAIVEMQNVFKTNADIIAEIDADDTLDEEIKATIISTIMNGRWFSDDLDEYYNTPSLW